MLTIVTFNVNGIRAACRKGFFEWIARLQPDIVCLQEVRADEATLNQATYHPPGYHVAYQIAEKKGYSGVGIYSRQKPDAIIRTLGYPLADTEGRYIAMQFGKLLIASIYFPSGTSGDHRQSEKYAFMDYFMRHLAAVKNQHQLILCGDYNIAHTKNDLKNWRSNQDHTGFLPEERAWMDKLFGPVGMVDAFRVINQETDQYTWWSHRGRAWENNTGWRIDYQVISPDLKLAVKTASIYKEERFSDHAPLVMGYDISSTNQA